MALLVKKTNFYQFLFILCVAIPYLNNFELTFAVWLFTILATLQNKYSLTFAKQIFCYSFILFLAFGVQFFKKYDVYFIIRDITYIIKPIFGLLIGYQLLKKIGQNPFKVVVNAGLITAIFHFVLLAIAVVVHKANTVNDIRTYAGFFNDFEVFALVIVLFHKKFNLEFSPNKIRIYLLVIGLSSFMYLARTNFIQLAILIFVLKGYFKVNKKSVTILFSFIGVIIIGYAAIFYINPKRNGNGLEAFLYKVKIAPIEPFKTRINKNNYKDLNDNYRSYENIMTVKEVGNDGVFSVLFGQGLGARIDLKIVMFLDNTEMRYISILHNGYMTVFLKSGIVGVLVLLFSFGLYFKKYPSQIPIVQQINLLMFGMGLFLILSYWVFMGYYFKADTKSILTGFLLALREFYVRNDKNTITENLPKLPA